MSSCECNVALDLVGEIFYLIIVEGSTFLGKKKNLNIVSSSLKVLFKEAFYEIILNLNGHRNTQVYVRLVAMLYFLKCSHVGSKPALSLALQDCKQTCVAR